MVEKHFLVWRTLFFRGMRTGHWVTVDLLTFRGKVVHCHWFESLEKNLEDGNLPLSRDVGWPSDVASHPTRNLIFGYVAENSL